MRFLIFFLFCVFSINSYAQQLEISPKVYNFGKIKEEDGIVKAVFEIKNISNSPYIINYSYTGCGCVASTISREPLMPNESRTVELFFDPKDRPGVINKEVTIISDNNRRKDFLRISGEVLPRKRSVNELYPISLGGGLHLSRNTFPFGAIVEGDNHTTTIDVYNSSAYSQTIDLVYNASNLHDVSMSSYTIAPNRVEQIMFTYKLKDNKYYGELQNDIHLLINDQKSDLVLTANGISIFNFFDMSDTEIKSTPRAIVSPLNYNVRVNELVTIPILNNGESRLEILSVICDDNISYSMDWKYLSTREEKNLYLTLKEGDSGVISLLINSYETPVVTLKLNKIQ